jgi:hypothetical protein
LFKRRGSQAISAQKCWRAGQNEVSASKNRAKVRAGNGWGGFAGHGRAYLPVNRMKCVFAGQKRGCFAREMGFLPGKWRVLEKIRTFAVLN